MNKAVNKFDPANHQYTTHHTYTGGGCAICGKSINQHAIQLVEVSQEELLKSGKLTGETANTMRLFLKKKEGA